MIQKPKGTYDIINKKADVYLAFKEIVRALMDKYNAKYIETPMFESSNLFHRSVGETTDIVTKETYDFKDRGNRDLTLRPEGTASIARAIIEDKLYVDTTPLKLWYIGPMFRYERPQAGRHRQFYQFGYEVFGSYDPMMDAEVISISVNLLKLLGLKDIKVNINTLGDNESRDNYHKALVDYFKPHIDELCDDCKNRLEKNPLRILDCKKDADNPIMKKAPKIEDYLNETSKEHFNKVKKYLDDLNINYEVNPNTVRGLDYYTHTVFEVEAKVEGFGAQNVLLGGGRYNNLVKNIGGPDLPGVGFAIGLERLFTALDFENIDITEDNDLDIYLFGKDEEEYLFELTNNLRMNGFNCEMDYNNRSFKANFKKADNLKAKYIIIVGEEEAKTNILTIKNNQTKEEFKVNRDNLITFFDERIDDHED